MLASRSRTPSAVEPRPLGGPGVRHGALVGLAHMGGVFGEKARLVAGRQWPPGGAASGDFRVAEEHVHAPACRVDAHDVAVAQQRERAADRRLRRDMADACEPPSP